MNDEIKKEEDYLGEINLDQFVKSGVLPEDTLEYLCTIREEVEELRNLVRLLTVKAEAMEVRNRLAKKIKLLKEEYLQNDLYEALNEE